MCCAMSLYLLKNRLIFKNFRANDSANTVLIKMYTYNNVEVLLKVIIFDQLLLVLWFLILGEK